MRIPTERFRQGRGYKGTTNLTLRIGTLLKLLFSQVMRVLLGDHGLNISGVKADLYTGIRA